MVFASFGMCERIKSMQTDIIGKLYQHLDNGVKTECEVVYLLCEVRKLLEMRPADQRPAALKLFCHWALHVELTKPGTTKHFLERIDDALDVLLGGVTTGETIARENALFNELAYFDDFRRELAEELRSHRLPAAICDDAEQWATFLAAYAGVIEDGSLACDLKWVSRATFQRDHHAVIDGSHVPFRMLWTVELKRDYNGFRKVEVTVSGRADRKMLSSGYSLQR